MIRIKPIIARASVASLALVASVSAAQPASRPQPTAPDNPSIIREGSGPRREALNARELKPFDGSAWSKITSWADGAGPSGSDVSGQVVLICTWKYYHPVSKRAMELARRLADQHAGELVVVAVHDAQNWEEAQKAAGAATKKEARFFVGLDGSSEFRKAVDSDGDPDFYVIDRAGQLRFADIATESVDSAVTMLVGETAEKAASRLAEIDAEREHARREAARSSGARESIDMSSIPAIPPGFTPPTADAFAAIKWPPTKFQAYSATPSSSGQTPPTPVIQLPEGEGWIGTRPELQGRVWVIYFWALDNHESYSVMQQMDQLQKSRGRDVAVVGILTRIRRQNTNTWEEKPEDPVQLIRKVTDFTRGKALQHATFVEPTGQLLQQTRGSENSEGIPVPYVVVCSSDGSVRFSGWAKHPSFESSLDNTLNMDPGVRARRNADAAFLRSKGK